MLSGWLFDMVEYADVASPGVSKEGIKKLSDIEEELVNLKVVHPIPYEGRSVAHVFKLKDGRYTFVLAYFGENQGSRNNFWMAISDSYDNLRNLVKGKYKPSIYVTSNALTYHAMDIIGDGKLFSLKECPHLALVKNSVTEVVSEYPWLDNFM